MKILITGGTVFVSKFAANYFLNKGNEVYVLNRGTREQINGVKLVKADRHDLKDTLRNINFDAVLDICAYNSDDINDLLSALGSFRNYILISSSAVYPETLSQPFSEDSKVGPNKIWGDYGIGKIEAEKALLKKVPNAYILRPPYLYGKMQNVYREPFVFECAENGRPFYIPNDGNLKLQFFDVEDLCRVIGQILKNHPADHIFNVGNKKLCDINTFVEICFDIVGTSLKKVYVKDYKGKNGQRDYFSFYNYAYTLNVERMETLLPKQKTLFDGLKESYEWYKDHRKDVVRKPYIDFIDKNFKNI